MHLPVGFEPQPLGSVVQCTKWLPIGFEPQPLGSVVQYSNDFVTLETNYVIINGRFTMFKHIVKLLVMWELGEAKNANCYRMPPPGRKF